MGCGGSKLDDLEAVVLCRDRTRLLAEAIGFRYALADAHAGYAKSLRSVGESLTTFLDSLQNLPPPALQLPTQRKGEDRGSVPAVLDHSSSGSHIHFHSDSEDLEGESDDHDDDDDDFPLHSDGDSPVHHHLNHKSPPLGPTVSYAKNQPPINSVSYEQRPMSPEIVHSGGGGGGEASSSSSSYPAPYYGYSYPPLPPQNPNLYGGGYPYGYPSNYGPYGEMGGYFGAASPPPPPLAASPVAQKAAPPPPSPPRVSTWDFINPFEGYDSSYFAPYTPSRSSREVREEEGIPDLEDEENVVVKEAYGDDKSTVGSSLESSPASRNGDKVNGVGVEGKKEKSVDAGGPSEENVVDKNVVESKAAEMEQKQNAATLPVKKYHDLPEVVQEVRSQFDRASESAVELAKLLEVGKQPYHQRNTVYKVSSRMICGGSSLSSAKDEVLVFEEDKSMGSGSLSSTLQKLYTWEKKLYDEVRVEEKMRVEHDKKCSEMKRLDERGAEAQKLDSTLNAVRKLSTKIKIVIQKMDSISNTVSKLRDDELWPQISELIQGLMRMWGVMLECHHIQCQALSEAKNLDTFGSGGKISDTHMDITKRLELELLDWVTSFSSWIHTQKNFVKTLNGWLLVGLRYVPEETPDGVAPFSPGRLGAPPLFVICNQWAQTMDRISETEVTDAMQAFASNVLHLWESHNFEQRQRLMANKDMDKTLRIMEREEQEMRRAVEAQNKKLALVSGQSSLALSEHSEASNLPDSLKQIFEAMENFSASTLKAYAELNMRAEEERSTRENEKVT